MRTIQYAIILLGLTVASQVGAQSIFVTDGVAVNRIETNGTISVYTAAVDNPLGLGVDGSGNLFVGSFGGNYIAKFTPGGTRTIFAQQVYLPTHILLDSQDHLYVVCYRYNETVPAGLKYDPDGMLVGGFHVYETLDPIAIDRLGNVYDVEPGTSYIIKTATNSVVSPFAMFFFDPTAAACDSSNNLLVASSDGNIYKFTPAGVQETFITGLANPHSLAFDNVGNLYVCEAEGTLYCYATNGVRSTLSTNVAAYQIVVRTSASPPSLGIAQTAGQTVLYWPEWAANYCVEASTDLTSTSWSVVTNLVPLVGASITNTSPSQFYRLRGL